jgi:hypothetical protein
MYVYIIKVCDGVSLIHMFDEHNVSRVGSAPGFRRFVVVTSAVKVLTFIERNWVSIHVVSTTKIVTIVTKSVKLSV